MNGNSHDFKSVLVLQNCKVLIKDEPDSGSEACVTAFDDGTEECNIKVEETLDIKEENSEGITCPTTKAEPEVSVCACVCSQQWFMFPRPFTATERDFFKITCNCYCLCTMHFV
jgi:hypothetical protein